MENTSHTTSDLDSDGLLASQSEPQSEGLRMFLFLAIVSAILFGAGWFVGATWIHFYEVSGLGWQLIPMLLSAGFVAGSMAGHRRRIPGLRLWMWLTSIWLGLLNFLFAAAVASWLIVALATSIHAPVTPHLVVLVCYTFAAVTTGWGLVNALTLRTTRVKVALPRLPAAWQGRTIALVSDLHLGNIHGARRIQRLVTRLKEVSPDAVLISGDMFDGAKIDADRVLKPWRALQAPRGTYFVSGNHDEFQTRAPLLEAIARTGIRVLHNEKVTVDGLQIVGLHDGEATDPRRHQSLLRSAEIDPTGASILLAHQPRNLAQAEEAGIGLQLSGHTHGGQFWPWTIVARRVHRRFNYGLHPFGRMRVITSSGAGTWGPPIRIGTRSELVLIRLEREVRAPGSGDSPTETTE